MRHLLLLAIACLSTISVPHLRAQSAWPLETGQLVVSPIFTVERFNKFYKGNNRFKTTGNVYQYSEILNLEYGLNPNLTLDLNTGYSHSPHSNWANASTTKSGRTDTTIGARYRVVDEFTSPNDWTPTVSLRVAGIIQGNYQTGAANAVGDGADGVDLAVLLGKNIPEWNGGYYGSFGYRIRNQNVPEQWLLSGGIFRNLGENWRANLGFTTEWATSGIDIASTEWVTHAAPKPFHRTKERRIALEAGLSYTDGANRTWSLIYGRVIDGRNTSLDNALTATVSFLY